MSRLLFGTLQTCVHCELGLAGVGSGQVLRGARVNPRVLSAGVEDDEGIFWVIVHKCEVAALQEKRVILRQTNNY